MYISECLKKYMPNIQYKIINEKEVDSMGLLISSSDKTICSFIDDEKYCSEIADNVKMLLIKKELFEKVQISNVGYVIVDEPRLVFFRLHNALSNEKEYVRSPFCTEIHETAKIDDYVNISKYNVKIGERVVIEPFVTIYENTVIENDSVIRSGSKIGGVGFEQKKDGKEIFLVKHLGGTVIRHNVEIQNNTCIDRGVYPWDDTVIGEYTKIDNLVHIGHAVKIGRSCMIVANSGIGGRTIVGNDVWIGFNVTIRNGIIIGNGARINMGSVVSRNVYEHQSVTGNFAIPHDIFINNLKNSLE